MTGPTGGWGREQAEPDRQAGHPSGYEAAGIPQDAGSAEHTGPAEQAAAEVVATGHPAVDAALHAVANAADLPPADQIAQYEAAHRTLQETLGTIDEG